MKIKASNGIGRPVNPYTNYENYCTGDFSEGEIEHYERDIKKYNDFERTAITAPTFLKNQPFMDSYEGEAELVWQFRHPGLEWRIEINDVGHEISVGHGLETRQIWRILPPAAVNLASGEQRELDDEEWIHSDEAAIGSLNDDLKAMTEQRDALLSACQQLIEHYEAKGQILTFKVDIIRQAINKSLGL